MAGFSFVFITISLKNGYSLPLLLDFERRNGLHVHFMQISELGLEPSLGYFHF